MKLPVFNKIKSWKKMGRSYLKLKQGRIQKSFTILPEVIAKSFVLNV